MDQRINTPKRVPINKLAYFEEGITMHSLQRGSKIVEDIGMAKRSAKLML